MPTPEAPPPQDAAINWLALDRQLCFALYSASLAMTKLYQPLLAELGLTYPQYLVMLALWESDGLSVSALGHKLSLDSGTLTPLLKRLEAAALLRRLRDSADERRVRIHLSEAGRALREAAARIPPTIACATQCDLAEISRLTQQLTRLRGQLQQAQQSHQAAA